MRKAVVIVFAFCVLATTAAAADSGWFWQNPLPRGNALRSDALLDADTVVAVGDFGTILKSTDGDATWTRQSSGTTNWLYAVSFTDANTGTVVGDLGTILRTTDGGATWRPLPSGIRDDLFGVSFTDARTGTAGGSGWHHPADQ